MAGPVPSPLVARLEAVAAWRDREERMLDEQRKALRAREDEARRLLEDHQRQLEAVVGESQDVEAKLIALDQAEVSRSRAALLASLREEAAVFARHAERYAAAVDAREREISERLATPEMAALHQEHQQFDEVSKTLASLPEGYQRAIKEHHDTVRRRLQPVFDFARSPLPLMETEREPISILAAVEPTDDGCVAQIVVPVDHGVHQALEARRDTLGAVLAMRIVGALGSALRELDGASKRDGALALARTEYDSHAGLFGVWIELERVDADVAKSAIGSALDRMRGDAHELAVAGLALYTVWVSPALLDEETPTPEGSALEVARA
jgi:hypothetical protein